MTKFSSPSDPLPAPEAKPAAAPSPTVPEAVAGNLPCARRRKTQDDYEQWARLYYKYSHVGCPAARMEDNCAHPDRCADNKRCIDLGPDPFGAIRP